jgi:ubiquinone/menaquinone biosynthesis C-methylase UbiE
MWESVEDTVDRQLPELTVAAKVRRAKGSLRVDPSLEIPRYIRAIDHHCMPGSYWHETGDGDVRAGAIFDAGANMYHLGVRGKKSDVMGLTIAAVVRGEYPDLRPKRLLDMGCTVGQSTIAIAESFPGAEVHAIDLGAPVIRYGHARAEALGVPIHFSQQNAERTDFPAGHFDLIVSHILFHETSAKAAARILNESYRLLKPGGAMVHMEVPVRYRDLSLYDQVIRGWQTHYNAEPFWDAVCTIDLVGLARAAGFAKPREGYVLWSRDPEREPRRLVSTPNQGKEWRYVLTARR